jgi:hypothetical protein
MAIHALTCVLVCVHHFTSLLQVVKCGEFGANHKRSDSMYEKQFAKYDFPVRFDLCHTT